MFCRVLGVLLGQLVQIKIGAGAARGEEAAPERATPKVGWISLGCPKNLVDSEGMMGDLSTAGYDFTPDLSEADAVVVNTCGFIEAARDESIAALRESL